MATATLAQPILMTTEEMLELPDDGKERWLRYGVLREKEMTKRNRFHCATMIRVGKFLDNWLDTQPEPRGWVVGGEAGIILARDPDLTVGVDVAYVTADVIVRQTDDTTLIEGVPTVAVEILSPYDTVQEIAEKRNDYLTAGVSHVWIIDPDVRIVTVFRPGQPPVTFNHTHDLTAEPDLPGFRVAVAALFR